MPANDLPNFLDEKKQHPLVAKAMFRGCCFLFVSDYFRLLMQLRSNLNDLVQAFFLRSSSSNID